MSIYNSLVKEVMLKKIFFFILAAFFVFLIIGLLLPGQINETHTIAIKAPIGYVFEEINELERWADWSYQQRHDPTMEITYGDRKSGLLATFSWKSKDGDGRFRFVKNFPDTLLSAELLVEDDTVFIKYKLKQKKDTIKVTVDYRTSKYKSPFSRWKALLLIKPEVRNALKYELSKIKENAESKPIFTVKITEESLAPTYYLGISRKINSNTPEFSNDKKKIFKELRTVFKASKAPVIDNPFCLFPRKNEVVFAMPMSPDSKFPPAYQVSQHYSGAAIKGIHVGSYVTLPDAHEQLKQYIKYKKFEMNGVPWEVYITDADKERDTTKWITEVYYPVK